MDNILTVGYATGAGNVDAPSAQTMCYTAYKSAFHVVPPPVTLVALGALAPSPAQTMFTPLIETISFLSTLHSQLKNGPTAVGLITASFNPLTSSEATLNLLTLYAPLNSILKAYRRRRRPFQGGISVGLCLYVCVNHHKLMRSIP